MENHLLRGHQLPLSHNKQQTMLLLFLLLWFIYYRLLCGFLACTGDSLSPVVSTLATRLDKCSSKDKGNEEGKEEEKQQEEHQQQQQEDEKEEEQEEEGGREKGKEKAIAYFLFKFANTEQKVIVFIVQCNPMRSYPT